MKVGKLELVLLIKLHQPANTRQYHTTSLPRSPVMSLFGPSFLPCVGEIKVGSADCQVKELYSLGCGEPVKYSQLHDAMQ